MTTTIVITTSLGADQKAFSMIVGETAQKHVLRTFNPSGDAKVDTTKVLCAAIIQQMLDLQSSPGATPAQKRAAEAAIAQCETLQMQAVKANFVQA